MSELIHMTMVAGSLLLGVRVVELEGRYAACDFSPIPTRASSFGDLEAWLLLKGMAANFPTCDHCRVLLDQCLEEGGR